MTNEESCLAFKERGHDAPLYSTKGLRLGCDVHVRELYHADERVAHEILTDIMAAFAAKEIDTLARYKGKNPLRWLSTVYPEASTPHFLGFFDDNGTLLSWAALSTTPSYPCCAMLGAIVRAPYRDQGLGGAIVKHCRHHARDIIGDTTMTDLFFHTQEINERVIHIAEKTEMELAGTRESVSGNRMIGFKIALIDD